MHTNQLRVAMIIQGYLPLVGGAERQLAAVAPLLQAQGVEIQIVTRRYPGLASFEMINGVAVHRLPIPGPKAVASLAFTFGALPLLRRLQPDVIHAHELLSPTTTAIAAKRWLGVPVVAKVLRGGVLGDIAKLKRKTFGTRRIATFRREVDAFITISREIDQELADVGVPAERRLFIPNGVNLERFTPVSAEAKRALRATMGLPDVPITIFIGRLATEKRVNHLIDLWPAVRAVHPDALLLLVGGGSEEAALKQAAGAGVQFVGLVDDVAPYLKAADLFVLPSATEGLSNALLEASAAALPTIATAVGGAPDVIDDGQSGWLVPPDDVPALQAALIALLGDAPRRAEFGSRARERVIQHYALPVTAQRLRTLYERLARGQSSTRNDQLPIQADG